MFPPGVSAHFAGKLTPNEAAPQRMTTEDEERWRQLEEPRTTRGFLIHPTISTENSWDPGIKAAFVFASVHFVSACCHFQK